MQQAENAFKLVREAKRQTEHLVTYNSDLVRQVCHEIRVLDKQRLSLASSPSTQDSAALSSATDDQPIACGIQFYHECVERQKRCLLAYHRHRMCFIERVVWALRAHPSLVVPNNRTAFSARPSSVDPSVGAPVHGFQPGQLSFPESEYSKRYAMLLRRYAHRVSRRHTAFGSRRIFGGNGDEDDLVLGDLEHPPKHLYVEVRVIRPGAEIKRQRQPNHEGEAEVVRLEVGTQHYLLRTEVERLIAFGYLEHIVS